MSHSGSAESRDVRMSAGDVLRLNRRALAIWWKDCPGMLLSSAAWAAAKSIFPYVGIYFSARILNELAGGRSPRALTRLVVLTLALTSTLGLLQAALNRSKLVQYKGSYYRLQKIYNEKLLSMDFCSVDDPRIHDLRARIRQNDTYAGWGLEKVLQIYESLLGAATKIGGAVALTVSLFTLPVPDSGGVFTVLNRPGVSILFGLAILALVVLASRFHSRADACLAECAEDLKLGNRMGMYYDFMAYDRYRAMDLRVYRQDILCGERMREIQRNGPFGPKGRLARYARGRMGICRGLSTAMAYVITGLAYVFVCLKAWAGAFSVGSVTQYIGAVISLSRGLADLFSAVGKLRNNAFYLRTVFQLLDLPNEMYQGSLTVEKRSDRSYEIEFRDVSFRYPGARDWALSHVSIRFRVGSRLAVVGENGSGKTTFIKLLCRLYDPTEGQILLNGIDIRKYNYREYMSVFSVVFQDFQLLAFPLGQNVGAAMEYDPEKAESALTDAGFGQKLSSLPGGLDTCLYKDFDASGVEGSGGEAQKIAIARALYKNSPFLILDEPTAALDPIAEAEIYTRLNDIVGDKTAIFISHRLSSCRFCDEILVFGSGRVLQQGSHGDLVAVEGGKYHELWEAQAQYYRA